MKHTVYAVRLKGDVEMRYVGLTYRNLEFRLRQHITSPCSVDFRAWLIAHRGEIEAFPIAQSYDREIAKATERTVIALCARFGHRLFNRAHVPKECAWKEAA